MDTIADLEHFSVIFPVSLRALVSAISLKNAPIFVSLFSIGIFSRAQNQPKRSAHLRKSSAEMFLKVALVGRREGIQRIAVNHDGGRVVSALMRITQFWPYQAWAARRLESGSRAQGEREFGRRQFAHPGLISGIDRTHQRLKSGFPKRRDKV